MDKIPLRYFTKGYIPASTWNILLVGLYYGIIKSFRL